VKGQGGGERTSIGRAALCFHEADVFQYVVIYISQSVLALVFRCADDGHDDDDEDDNDGDANNDAHLHIFPPHVLAYTVRSTAEALCGDRQIICAS
jgi:hypothetical protein